MTTYSDTQSQMPEGVSGPGDLLAAIPAFLGFTPHRSLVVICLDDTAGGGPTIGMVMRHDLKLPEPVEDEHQLWGRVSAEMAKVTAHFAEICARDDVRGALALIVDDRARPSERGTRADRHCRAVARRLARDLRDRGTELAQVYLTAELVLGSRWWTAFGPAESGTIPDPTTSPVTLAYLLEGRGVHESRDKLAEAIEPVDTAVSRTVEELLRSGRSRDRGSDRMRLDAILSRLAMWAASSPDHPAVVALPTETIAEFGLALRNVMVRDSLLAITLTGFAELAEQLWSYLMRILPAPERACPATLLGFSAYARGEGALATLALDIALDADPDYSLAQLLDRSLLAGARPAMIREVALSGYAVAELCGVRLPPPLE
ncbi:MAG: DUF4192 domain-containing protein [Rhodococcus sp. (in: high G+C Gram-positive bacteria)]